MIIIIPMDEEIFKDVEYPGIMKGRYLVSNYGEVFDKFSGRFKNYDQKERRYFNLYLRTKDNKKINIGVHRIVAHAFCNGYDEKLARVIVNHKDSNTHNNYYENLEWVTQSENNFHRYEHGNGSKSKPPIYLGEEHPMSVYDDIIVENICRLLQESNSVIQIMRSYGYNGQNDNKKFYNLIYDIKRKRTWTHISDKYIF